MPRARLPQMARPPPLTPHYRNSRSPIPMQVEEVVPSPAMFVECCSSVSPLPPSSSNARPIRARALRNDDIEAVLNFGSEPKSDGDSDEDEVAALSISKVFQVLMETPEDDEDSPPPQQSSPLPSLSAAATPSSPTSALVETYDFLDFKWKSFPNPPIPSDMRRDVFSNSNVGPTVPQADTYEIFDRVWDQRLMEHIASETNKYAQQFAEQLIEAQSLHPSSRICDWKDTSADDLYVFFAITTAMGTVAKGRLMDYWSAKASIFVTPSFHVYMFLRRFQLNCKCLHFRNNKDMYALNLDRPEAKLFKIQPIIDYLNSVFQSSYNLQQNIALDESLQQWNGWLDINQFIPNKAKWQSGGFWFTLISVQKLLLLIRYRHSYRPLPFSSYKSSRTRVIRYGWTTLIIHWLTPEN